MIELGETQAALLGIVFTLVGALIGALAAVYAARLTAERQHLYVESAIFRMSFVPEIIALREAAFDAFTILDEATMKRHMTAKVRFEPWVAKRRSESFARDWDHYVQSIKTTAPGRMDTRRADCAAALAQIEKLMSYAKTKG